MTEPAETSAETFTEAQPGNTSEAADGLSVLRGRMQRGSRVVRPPRNPIERSSPDTVAPTSTSRGVENQNQPSTAVAPATRPVQEDGPAGIRQTQAQRRPDPDIAGEELTSNLAVRVRRSLDRRLDTLLHELKMSGTKSSKVEIIELLLWELPASADDHLRHRLREFRAATRREW
jgi:hypothetical protein